MRNFDSSIVEKVVNSKFWMNNRKDPGPGPLIPNIYESDPDPEHCIYDKKKKFRNDKNNGWGGPF
jgi:hypothetical protein